MIDLSVIAAAGPILLGVGAGIAGRRALRVLDQRHEQRVASRRRIAATRPGATR